MLTALVSTGAFYGLGPIRSNFFHALLKKDVKDLNDILAGARWAMNHRSNLANAVLCFFINHFFFDRARTIDIVIAACTILAKG